MKSIISSKLIALYTLIILVNVAGNSYGHKEKYALGSINGTSISIPNEYTYFPVNYIGEDIWAGKRLNIEPTLSTPISTASLIVRLPDMTPKTTANEKERIHAIRTSDRRLWITIQIEGHKTEEHPWVKAVVHRIKNRNSFVEKAVGWEYRKAGGKFGLTEELLTGGDEKLRKKYWTSDENLMYDEHKWTSYIQCNTNELKYNSKQVCTQTFSLKPTMNAFVKVRYESSNLKDWSIIQDKLTKLINSFIVRN